MCSCWAHKCMLLSFINSTSRRSLQGPGHICQAAAAHMVLGESVCMLPSDVLQLAHSSQVPLPWQHSENWHFSQGCVLQVRLQSPMLGLKKIFFKEIVSGFRASFLLDTLPCSNFHIWLLSSYHSFTNQNKGNMRNDWKFYAKYENCLEDVVAAATQRTQLLPERAGLWFVSSTLFYGSQNFPFEKFKWLFGKELSEACGASWDMIYF